MAALTFYLTNTALSTIWAEMSESAPSSGTSSPNTGWTVAKVASGNYSAMRVNTERASNTFGTTVLPAAGSLDSTNGDGFRSTNAYTGSFESANWTFTFEITAVGVGGTQDGNLGLRLYRSANADGSSATEITSARQETSIVTNLATSATTEITLTFNPGAFSLTNEYLFVQLAWEITGAGGNNSCDVIFRIGTNETRIVTSSFGAANTLACAQASFTLTGNAATFPVARAPLTAAQASFALTGSDVTFHLGSTLTAAQGSFALTGSDIVLTTALSLALDAGAFTLTGVDAALPLNRALVAAQGSFDLTGFDVALPVNRALVADQGAFALTGNAITLAYAARLDAATGSFVLTGEDVALVHAAVLVLTNGTFTLTGIDADLVYTPGGGTNYPLVCDAGLFTLSGQSVALSAALRLVLGQSAFTLTGFDANLDYSAGGGDHTLVCEPALYRLRIGATPLYQPVGVFNYVGYRNRAISLRFVRDEQGRRFLIRINAYPPGR